MLPLWALHFRDSTSLLRDYTKPLHTRAEVLEPDADLYFLMRWCLFIERKREQHRINFFFFGFDSRKKEKLKRREISKSVNTNTG